jgi:CheY-like chemotaxis protein
MILRRAQHTKSRTRSLRGITRPYTPRRAGEDVTPESPPAAAAERKPGVLVVEGEGSIRTVLSLVLRQHGFAVWQANAVPDALQLLTQQEQTVDVVLLDTALPGFCGPEVIRVLREISPAVRCCFLDAGTGEAGLCEMDVAHVFSKPVQLAAITRELRRVVLGEEKPPSPEPRPAVVDVAQPPGDERRTTVRFRCELDYSCQPVGRSGEFWQGEVRDLSAGGVRLILARRFEAGTVLNIAVASASGQTAHRLLARVVRLAEEPDGQWSLGCSLVSPLEESEVRDLLG